NDNARLTARNIVLRLIALLFCDFMCCHLFLYLMGIDPHTVAESRLAFSNFHADGQFNAPRREKRGLRPVQTCTDSNTQVMTLFTFCAVVSASPTC
ncbi:hypothetical protein, partial [Rhodoferax sp.]|uniref:hypothetical protein n=1 Tax=Rhodoferax sp. TaxID=50421 RepID=UPI002724EC1C